MTQEVLNDALVTVNAVDLSDHVASVTTTASEELVELPAMGDSGTRRLSSGIRDFSAEIEFNQDFAAASVEATLWPLIGVQTAVVIRKSKTSPISATNPEYRFNAMIPEFSPISGAVGEGHKTSITLENSDGVAVVRATA